MQLRIAQLLRFMEWANFYYEILTLTLWNIVTYRCYITKKGSGYGTKDISIHAVITCFESHIVAVCRYMESIFLHGLK